MEIGEVAGVKVCVSPEQFEEIKKQKLIEENKILKEQQEEIERLNNIIKEAFKYVDDKLREINLHYGSDNEFREEWDYLYEILDKEM